MPTPRETILAALHARLSALPATALRGEVLPERVPADGLLILRDGEPGEPEVTLSPLAYHYQHRAEIEAVVQGAARDADFDTLTASIGAALAADRTLGGLCDWVEAEAPRPVDLPVEGAASLKAAVIPVVLHYATDDPLTGRPLSRAPSGFCSRTPYSRFIAAPKKFARTNVRAEIPGAVRTSVRTFLTVARAAARAGAGKAIAVVGAGGGAGRALAGARRARAAPDGVGARGPGTAHGGAAPGALGLGARRASV